MTEFVGMNLNAFVRTHNSRNTMCLCTLVRTENIIRTAFVQMMLVATACSGK